MNLSTVKRSSLAILLVSAVTAFLALFGSGAVASAATGKSTWVIGNVGTYSGDNASPFAGSGAVIQAWVDWTNAHGGIDGHQLKLIEKDDAGVPSTSVNEVKQLINQDHVLALVGMNSGVEANWGAYVQSTGVPVVGGSTPIPDFFMKSDFYPSGTTANESVADLLLYAKQKLNNTVGGFLYCVEAPVCAQLQPVYAAAYKAIGGKLAYSSSFSSTAPSYAAQCLAAKNDGVQDLEIAGPSPATVKIAQDCAALGYHPTLLLNAVSLTPQISKELGSTKAIYTADSFPFSYTKGPAADFYQALKKYEPSVLNAANFTEIDASDWVAGQIFAAAAKAGNLGNNPTPAQLVAGLDKLKKTTLGGLSQPITYAKGKPSTVSCVFVMSQKNGTIATPNGLKPFCPAA
jgi:branched-chain amino acid transport system substrate-binding protein